MLILVGGLVLLIGGTVIFKILSGVFKILKPLLLMIVVLLIFLLVSKAKRGRPITFSKVSRRARNFSNRRASDIGGYDTRYTHPDYDEPYRDYGRSNNYENYSRPRSNCIYGRDCEEYDECRGEYECIYSRRPQRDSRNRVRREERDRRTERMHVGR